ncbi:MAG: LysM peptidoglycan-binding domain-containing protein [Anaerolineae bacterium]|nr:LysM peptidoglycan-binding domain-containing protein [Anaerolineae bacterium]
MRSRNQILYLALLALAILGPLFHILGILSRGLGFFYSAYPRLILVYGILAVSAAAAAFLALRRGGFLLRLLAGIALIANLASVAYAGKAWSRDIGRALEEVELIPIEAGKVGILVSPTDHSTQASEEARALENLMQEVIQRLNFSPYIVIRHAYPVSSEAQALRLGEKMRANIVVWSTEKSPTAKTYYVTVLGANETAISLEPLSLMLLMMTQGTFALEVQPSAEEKLPAYLSEVIMPVATGFGLLAIGQPSYAAAQFQRALQYPALPAESASTLHNYFGTTLLFLKRPDLAYKEYQAANEKKTNALSWVGLGNTALSQREWFQAQEAYNRAIGLDPYKPEGYCGLGILLARQRNVRKAIAVYQQAISLEPTRSVPYALLGMAYELTGDIEAARKAYQTCALYAGPNAGLQLAVSERAQQILRNPPTPIPTATPRPLPTPTPIPTSAMYRVQRGDTLQGIAAKFGVSVDAIVELNELENPDAIRVGQILLIPQSP